MCSGILILKLLKMKMMAGVESAEADLKKSEVSVKGVFETAKLVEHVYKRTGKHAVIVKPEMQEKHIKRAKIVNVLVYS